MNLMRTLLTAGVVVLASATQSLAQTTILQKAVVSAGGTTSASASTRLDYTIAEPVTGIATNGQTVGQFGFWTASTAITLGVGERAGAIARLRLSPNPVVDKARLSVVLLAAGSVEISLYDERGRAIAVRPIGRLEAGEHQLALDLGGLASGSYSLVAAIDGAMTRIPLAVVR